jgi:hypothetical protein
MSPLGIWNDTCSRVCFALYPLLTDRLGSRLPGASLQLSFETVLKWPEIAPLYFDL